MSKPPPKPDKKALADVDARLRSAFQTIEAKSAPIDLRMAARDGKPADNRN